MSRERSSDGGSRRSRGRFVVLAFGLVLAAAATAALVATEDPKLLRLALVGALWAFVLAGIAAPRRRVASATEGGELPAVKEAHLRQTYEAELEREVAARREYELQLEVQLRREVEQGLRDDVGALREEVERLRTDLVERIDGDLQLERVESTRLVAGQLHALQEEARRLGFARSPQGAPYDDRDLGQPAFTTREPVGRLELTAGPPASGLPPSGTHPGFQVPGNPLSGPGRAAGQGYDYPPNGREAFDRPYPPDTPERSWMDVDDRIPAPPAQRREPPRAYGDPVGPAMPGAVSYPGPPPAGPSGPIPFRPVHAQPGEHRPNGRDGYSEQPGYSPPVGPGGPVGPGYRPPPGPPGVLPAATGPGGPGPVEYAPSLDPHARKPGETTGEHRRRRRYRDDGEPNEVMSRLLGRG